MDKEKKVLAIDLGASGGRAMLVTLCDDAMVLQEVHRFSNDPVTVNGTMYWDVLRLFHEIKQSLVKAKKYGCIQSIAVDTWGVDFGFIDQKGYLLENPVHYRDGRTRGMIEKVTESITRERLYSITGNQFMEFNTVFQLAAFMQQRREVVEHAKTMLLMPDLFHYFLTGVTSAEISIASTTQLFDLQKQVWSTEIISALGLPETLFPPIIQSGTKIGTVSDEICHELGIDKLDVIAVAGHDTQSALVSAPASEKDFIFLSCGTWSLLGTEIDMPIINQQSFHYDVTNEYAYKNKVSFLKNIVGLWLVQESRRQWIREGTSYEFSELVNMARSAPAFGSFIDPDDPVFMPAGNIPERIRQYCQKTGQPIPRSEAEIIRCIEESLALKYRCSIEEIMECTGKTYAKIYMIGGGIQDELLCEMTAGACMREVLAGPVEATVLGNAAIQLIAEGSIKDIHHARRIIHGSQNIKQYLPGHESKWEAAYLRFKELLAKK